MISVVTPCRLAGSRLRLTCDGTRAETRFRLSPKRTSPFKSAGASIQSTAGSRGVRISCSNAGHTVFRGSVKSTGYPLLSPVPPSFPLPCVTVCHQVSKALYVLPPFSGTKRKQPVFLKWYPSTKVHIVASHKSVIFIVPARRASDLMLTH